VGPDASERTREQGERPPDGPGWSALLREVERELREERKRLEPHVGWRALAEAERRLAPGLAQEAVRRLREAAPRRAPEADTSSGGEAEECERFSLLFRLQHVALLLSTLVLIVTGLPLRYSETSWAQAFFSWIGGVPVQAVVHRAAAALLIGVGSFHTAYITLTGEGRRELLALFPRPKDFGDLLGNLAYFVGLVRRGPRFDRFSYVEKFDYWAVYWGIVIMVGSGLVLWQPALTMRVLPKYLLDIAHVIHSDEALLAAMAIAVWHFYNVHFNPDCFPMNWAWLTGRISRQQMKKHHPLEYEKRYAAREHGTDGTGGTG